MIIFLVCTGLVSIEMLRHLYVVVKASITILENKIDYQISTVLTYPPEMSFSLFACSRSSQVPTPPATGYVRFTFW